MFIKGEHLSDEDPAVLDGDSEPVVDELEDL